MHFLLMHFKIFPNSFKANFLDFLFLSSIKLFSVKDKNDIIILIAVDIMVEYNI